MDNPKKVFKSPYFLAEFFGHELVGMIKESAKRKMPLTIALSGGSTPELLFSVLGDHFSNSAPWEFVHFFWGDERCVPPESPDSNYGTSRRIFLDKIGIPAQNIHRIRGEDNPLNESLRYSLEISEFTKEREGLPAFDLIILGLGEDGHTASIFQGNNDLLNSGEICQVAIQPTTRQNRITITTSVINNAVSVVFLVTGIKKAEIVEKIINKNPSSQYYPAARISPKYGDLTWYLDEDAASLL